MTAPAQPGATGETTPEPAAFTVVVPLPIAEAEQAVREALGAEGFGVLTEIDVAATLKAKLNVDRPPLRILGACNPGLANRALERDPSVALLLPCNVVLEPAPDDPSATRVAIADPRGLLAGPAMADLADEAAERIGAVVGTLGGA